MRKRNRFEPNWQMEYNWIRNQKSFKYFQADENPREAAIASANAYMQERKKGIPDFMRHQPYLPRVIVVRQYDNAKKCAVKGGERFVLIRNAFTIQTTPRLIQEELYELLTKNK